MNNSIGTSQHSNNIKEVIFFTYGDSNDASTWSNVPYLFAKSLIRHDIVVSRVNLFDFPRWILKLYKWTIGRVYKLFHRCTSHNFYRSGVFRKLCQKKIKKAIDEFPGADLCIFTNFELYNSFSDIPSLLLCDWTYEIFIRDRLKREPDRLEKRFIRWQNQALTNAEHVISLFRKSTAQIRHYCPGAKVVNLGINVVNDMSHEYSANETDKTKLISDKHNHLNILFIGSIKYRDGAQCLIASFKIIRKSYPEAKLHIVGMTDAELNCSAEDGVSCYGYLRKDDTQQNRLYYELMRKATVLVNPTPIWAGYSSMIEAMYNYTPVVVSPYDDFVEEFSTDIQFGIYQKDTSPQSIANSIIKIYKGPGYRTMCENAHNAVKDYNWDNYVDLILEHVQHC